VSEERVERKLTTILAADVVGYSRLMGEDEAGTLARLKSLRKELMQPKIAGSRGRIVKLMGDGLLAEFPSVVEAVRCAVDIQQCMAGREAGLPDERRIRLRIGVNLGDIIVEGSDIYGDGVNVAARLEGLAEAGGICISGKVYEEIKNKLPIAFEDLGEREVKNIREPIRVYRWTDVAADPKPSMAGAKGALPLPDKPSIAVLPFDNMSGDPEQEYFSDGISEDLITDLSKISGIFVVSRHAAFLYKGKAVRPEQVSRELAVRYILEGSIRKAENRVRITAQLIDATTGFHLWAERYDRDLDDIFSVQDEITQKIVAALEVKLTEGEQERVAHRYTESAKAYDVYLRAREYYLRFNKEANMQAQQLYERAIEIDPNYAPAYAELSLTYFVEWYRQWSEDPQALDRGLEAAQRAVTLDDFLPEAHTMLGWIHLWRKRHEQAIAEGERAIALDPNYADGYARLGYILSFSGRPEEAIGLIKKAMRLDPHYPFVYLCYLGHSYYLAGQIEEAIAALKRAIARNPDYLSSYRWLAAIYSELGREEEARTAVAEILRISPLSSIEFSRKSIPYKDPPILERCIDALRKAGLPD
jgi:TolB-like protein/cytochrome c-type biogenesis protein CcmH/NrfG